MTIKDLNELYFKEFPAEEEEKILLEGISSEAYKIRGMGKIIPFSFFVKNPKGRIFAGIKGFSFYGCLSIDSLWVAPEYRKRGWGKRLMEEAEKLGKERKCMFAATTTMDWEALEFYQKLHYLIDYVRPGFEKNSKMFFLRKKF